jgi:DTW domain-containing protein YfiP
MCAGERVVESPLRVDVLMHVMESYRPSSTGHLIKRVMPSSGQHLIGRETTPTREEVVQLDRELWVLHPQGESLPAAPEPERLQVLLIDGTWVQSTEMARHAGTWGRRVRLPMEGESRYWLRTQAGEGRFSTIEALLFLMQALGLAEAHAALRAQFELHVYATLRARGFKEKATAYLATSPIREVFPEVLARLDERRPNVNA